MEKIRIGLNGFGRIGRVIAKIIQEKDEFELVHINELVANQDNMTYLFNYDSVYGQMKNKMSSFRDGEVEVGESKIKYTSKRRVTEVPWSDSGADYIIDATGVKSNLLESKELVKQRKVKKVICTNSPPEGADFIAIMGINEHLFQDDVHDVIGSSICDANAIAHALKAVDEKYGIESAFITTLHPWLSYQNLVDSAISSQQDPKNIWPDYSLGRSSPGTLIPKQTTAAHAVLQVMPELRGKVEAISFRVPTQIVSTADCSVLLTNNATASEVNQILSELANSSSYLSANLEPLVGVDYCRTNSSAIFDLQWTKVMNNKLLKLVLWYDNEWGYSSRVLDLLKFIHSRI